MKKEKIKIKNGLVRKGKYYIGQDAGKIELKQTLTIKDFPIKETEESSYVPWKDIERIMGKRKFKKFMKWMRGQTCIEDGVYPWDLESYLRQKNRGIKDPHIWD